MRDIQKDDSVFFAYISRMPLIKRWSLMFTSEAENIAEHSHQVAVIVHLLAVIKNQLFDGNTDPYKLATMALYHDASEVITQDVVASVKYSSPTLLKEFKKLESEAEKHVFKTLPPALHDAFSDVILSDTFNAEDKKLLKAADVLGAYIKATIECDKHQNKEFIHVKEKSGKTLQAFCETMPEVKYFMDTFVNGCIATVDEISEYAATL